MLNKLILPKCLLFVALMGCESGDYVYFDDPPPIVRSEKVYPLRNVVRDNRIDILWVVDNSGSMSDIQNNIIRNTSLFMQEFMQDNVMQWRMGVMSTDVNEKPYLGFSSSFNNNDPDPIGEFQRAIGALGTSGSPSEYVFYNVSRGLGLQTPYDQFYRNDAHLAVIMVTDEKEQSRDYGQQYQAIPFLNSIKALKSPDRIIRFYGAFQFRDLDDCGYGGVDRYENSPFQEVITLTGGIHMSACVSDFGSKLAEISEDIVNIVDIPRILLEERPVIKTIEVLYNGLKLPGGKESEGGFWYYSKYFNTINFYNLDFAPDISNADIKINFDIDDGYDHDEWRE
ncbi:MAG: hypothetical protein CME65_06415 [Halobacteriovoraceae bacterium]|nr:hypothetical protein [Halobacteriovoraceae bacterium]|tara:strand:- start:1415 stop:2434 length:1020 start_codon:yes stop_codon:yes gene_type:complete